MWYRIIQIVEWFGEMKERYMLIRDFNRAARDYYVRGIAPTLLEARITKGESAYRHAYSKFLGGGFRIKAFMGRPLERFELIEIGRVILDNATLVRRLISLGWDTLEIHENRDFHGAKWPLKDYVRIGGELTE